jgi:transcriptional regulator with XRE-family HTH domain
MTGNQLRTARKSKGWDQKEAATKLGLSQPYLSQLERGQRSVPGHVARKALKLLEMPATTLPVKLRTKEVRPIAGDTLASQLAALGYPGFAYLQPSRQKNPAEVLLRALAAGNLDGRLAEALPWVPFRYPDLDWQWLVREAKVNDLQNRLGYVTSVARRMAERVGDRTRAAKLRRQEAALEASRLLREDTLCQASMTEAEKRWLQSNRPPEAEHWRLLTDLLPEHLNHANYAAA